VAALLAAVAWLALPPDASAAPAPDARPAPVYTGNFIVRWRDAAATAQENDRLRRVRDTTGLDLAVKRQMGGNFQLVGAAKGNLSSAGNAAQIEATAARLRQDPRVADVVPDRWLRLHDTVPNDPEFAPAQPYLGLPSQAVGAANLPPAWDRTQGSTSVVVAVVDTGYLPHPDLASRFVAGYDFIADANISLDGDGRDADPTDAGDNAPAGHVCPGSSTPIAEATVNSWHGTRVASVLGALTNNGQGIAGVDWNARIQPVRVSGRCGALLSDTVDGMRWAAGLPVPNVPANATPARVVNVSLGGGTCTSVEQQAVNDLAARGVVVVAAAGNNAGAPEAPADCSGVVAVTAHANDGDNASYASVGPQITLSAPGGGCGNSSVSNGTCRGPVSLIRTLSNTGTTSPGDYTIVNSAGTSFAAPVVSGVVSLMLAVRNDMTTPQVINALTSTARPHPAGTYCTQAGNPGVCGAGLLDASGAVTLAATGTPPASGPGGGTGSAPPADDGGGGGASAPWLGALLALAGLLIGVPGLAYRRSRATEQR
jgi:serine protease